MSMKTSSTTHKPPVIYLIRHGSPDWGRVDYKTYHLLPGPPLAQWGQDEAHELGIFMQGQGIHHLLSSPFQRCQQTAQIVRGYTGATLQTRQGLHETQPGETDEQIFNRMCSVLDEAELLSQDGGPAALVTHGAPVMALLAGLGMLESEINRYRLFDHRTLIPTAGAWRLQRRDEGGWQMDLVFVPERSRELLVEASHVEKFPGLDSLLSLGIMPGQIESD
jgi:broad specificity phosphatase PhoE